MYYLSACNRGLFKKYYCYVLFLSFEKSLKYYENLFLIPSLYFLKKRFPITNIRNKCVIRKINLFFFDVMKNGQIFPSKVFHFQYDQRFLLSREMGNIRTCKGRTLQKLTQFTLSL